MRLASPTAEVIIMNGLVGFSQALPLILLVSLCHRKNNFHMCVYLWKLYVCGLTGRALDAQSRSTCVT